MEYHPVQQHQLGEVGAGQNGAAQQRHPALLPDHLDQVGKFDLAQRQAADHRDAGLRAAVAAGVHQHGNIGGEDGEGAEGVLKAGDDLAGKGGGDHQQQQPRNTGFEGVKGTGAEVGLVRRQHSRHLFHILRGLFLQNVDGVIDGDDTHQAIFCVHHGEGQKVILA